MTTERKDKLTKAYLKKVKERIKRGEKIVINICGPKPRAVFRFGKRTFFDDGSSEDV